MYRDHLTWDFEGFAIFNFFYFAIEHLNAYNFLL